MILDEIKNLHEAALTLLLETGFKIDHHEAVKLLKDNGSRYEDGRAYLPKSLVKKALVEIKESSGQIQLYTRDGEEAILLKNGNTFFGPGSDALYQIDLETGEKRNTKLEDIATNTRLAHALPYYDFVMSMGLPQDVEADKLYPTVFEQMVQNTTKPIVTTLTTLSDMKRIHEIGAIAAGGKDQLKNKPFFVAYLEPISPLLLDEQGVARILYCAEHEIPFLFAAGANLGATAPITPEWGVLQGHAESLAGMLLAYLKNPKSKFICGANTSSMDMSTAIVGYGAPEWFKTVGLYAQLGKLLGLPSWGTAGCSDSFKIDAQAGIEAYEGILFALQNKSTFVHDMGYLAHGELNDPGMHVLVNELVRRAMHSLSKPNFSKDYLEEGIKVIDDVAKEDNKLFLAHKSTQKRFKQVLWMPPRYWERRNLDKYPGEDLSSQLRNVAKKEIENHKPAELAQEKRDKIRNYI